MDGVLAADNAALSLTAERKKEKNEGRPRKERTNLSKTNLGKESIHY